jgi:4-hydroxy-3-polyprenylbenzoate decarboxylase
MDMPVEGVFHNLVIAQIKKDYAGQAQKVMNAMWGAGQMMFNKILVIGDEAVKIQDYTSLAQYVFKNLNPATDIYFSTGPMDVLDHSCSKLGFGGKMCIDGTKKFDEEKDDSYEFRVSGLPAVRVSPEALAEAQAFVPAGFGLTEESLRSKFSEIKAVNTSLVQKNIPCMIVSVEKNRKGHIRELHEQICDLPEVAAVKMILYVEHTVDAHDLPTALWRLCNNLDPKRDYHLCKRPMNVIASGARQHDSRLSTPDSYSACIGFDGTRKTKEFDDFHRDWPNIIVADSETIKTVDNKWEQLGIGPFIPSPSLKFKQQLYGEEAVVS